MRERQALTGEVAKRYRKAKKAEKSRILSEFVANSGYNRKYAIHILMHEGKVKLKRVDGELVAIKIAHRQKKKRVYKRYYDEPVEKSVLAIWWFFDMMCGQRLVPLIRANIENLATEPFFEINEVVKKKLQEISVSTVERMLKPERKKLKLRGTCTTTPGATLKSQIPIRVYFDWDERLPGFFEIDTVAHDGGVASGEYCFTLTVTDVFSGWVEVRPLLNKAAKWVKEAMSDIFEALPFRMKGADSDNGSEFINETMLAWCNEHEVTFTRSRPYKKNDNCFVEQKNGAAVRGAVGYHRFEGQAMRDALAAVYEAYCPLLNYFYPCSKLLAKERVGMKVKKTREVPKPPFQRLLQRADVSDEIKAELIRRKSLLNLVEQKRIFERALEKLMALVQDK